MNKRLFAAIDVPDPIQHSLHVLDPDIAGVRWTEPGQMHLTLGFFGYVDAEPGSRLRDKLAAIEFGSFFLPLAGLGTFPAKRDPKIIWVGVGTGHPHLFQLHKRVQEAALAAGIEPDLRPWHPHITLARCVGVRWQTLKKFLHQNAELDLGGIRVEAFNLYSSQLTPEGAIHTRELSVKARDAAAIDQ